MNRGAAFYRNVVRLALPILLQNLCTTLLGLIDTFMVGALGEAPLAAVLVANIPVFVIQLVIFGLQSGSSVLISSADSPSWPASTGARGTPSPLTGSSAWAAMWRGPSPWPLPPSCSSFRSS